MKRTMALRPAELERDFGQLAALFSLEESEPTFEPALKEDYEAHKERIFRLMVAEDERGELLGFNWAVHSRFDASQAYIYLIVRPEQRRQGVGGRLYEDMEQAARSASVRQMRVTLRDDCPECRAFAEKRGFAEKAHSMGLALGLGGFDDRRYDGLIARLTGEGLQFTSMEALGNTEDAQHKLYLLNDSTSMERVLPDGGHDWLSFEDFQQKVCQMDWYKPGGQLVAIDSASGAWAAMSAVTRFAGSDHAYHLHTGVDPRYHGRGLARAMLVLALRYARDVLKVERVQTEENAADLPTVAIYRELGYTQIAGTLSMEKALE